MRHVTRARTLGLAHCASTCSFVPHPEIAVPDLLPIVAPRLPTLKAVAIVALAGLALAGAAHAEVDPIVMFDGFDGCAPVQREIGPEGGSLRLCGAELAVPPDALAAPTMFGIERLA